MVRVDILALALLFRIDRIVEKGDIKLDFDLDLRFIAVLAVRFFVLNTSWGILVGLGVICSSFLLCS